MVQMWVGSDRPDALPNDEAVRESRAERPHEQQQAGPATEGSPVRMLALRFALAVLLAACPPSRVPAGMKALRDHLARGARTSAVGDWVTYRLDGGGARVHYWRMAVVGEEKDQYERDAVWLEMEMGTHPAMGAFGKVVSTYTRARPSFRKASRSVVHSASPVELTPMPLLCYYAAH